MQYALALLLSFAGAALAQTDGFDAITSPAQGTTINAGETFTVQWSAAPAKFDNELIDIVLLAGSSPQTLNPVDPPIAKGLKNSVGKFDWDVPSSLGKEKTYGFKILLESDPTTFQFSFPFAIKGSSGSSSGNSTSSSKPTSSTSSADADATSASSSTAVKPKTTLYQTVGDSSATAGAGAATPAPTAKASPGAGAQVTAGAFAVIGGLAIAALGL